MDYKLFVLATALFFSACWPGPSYKDKDLRCKGWNNISRNMNGDEMEAMAKSLDVVDRYYYYICINGMNNYGYPRPEVFLDDAESFLKLVPSLLNNTSTGYQLYLMSKICVEIAKVKPRVAMKYALSIEALKASADKEKSVWKDPIRNNINLIIQNIQ